jgi:ribonucleoside-diphosphate reductase alpha chain
MSLPETVFAPARAVRRHLPDQRRGITHHFTLGGQEGYLIIGVYDDGAPGEIFIIMAKEGSTISGLMDSFATVVSLALQHGVPLELLCKKFSHTRFEPSGWSGNPEIGYAHSLMDYLFRYLELKFLKNAQQPLFPPLATSEETAQPANVSSGSMEALSHEIRLGDSSCCNICGALMVRSGSCQRCPNCGQTSGCS